jgi:phage I-like protein
MKKHTKSKTAIAVLTAQNPNEESLAVLTFTESAINVTENNRVQILPDGYFTPTDGREVDVESGKWLMDQQAFESLQTFVSQRTNDLLFDYEHQTLNSDENGKPAPAAGWFKKLDYVPGEGLFAVDVDWTEPAAQFIKNKEYRYTSAVFSFDRKTGRPIELKHVALTNNPALDGMKAIAALTAKKNLTGITATSTGETPMNEALKMMLALLGIAHTDDDLTSATALTAIQDKAKVAITALKTNADKSGQLEKDLNTAQSSVTALKAQAKAAGKDVDLSKFVPVETYDAALKQVSSLTASNDENSIEQLLKDNDDKTFASESSYLIDFGQQQGVTALKAMLDVRPAIAALKTKQTQNTKSPDIQDAVLTADEKYTAEQLGLSHADFIKHKEKMNKES